MSFVLDKFSVHFAVHWIGLAGWLDWRFILCSHMLSCNFISRNLKEDNFRFDFVQYEAMTVIHSNLQHFVILIIVFIIQIESTSSSSVMFSLSCQLHRLTVSDFSEVFERFCYEEWLSEYIRSWLKLLHMNWSWWLQWHRIINES